MSKYPFKKTMLDLFVTTELLASESSVRTCVSSVMKNAIMMTFFLTIRVNNVALLMTTAVSGTTLPGLSIERELDRADALVCLTVEAVIS